MVSSVHTIDFTRLELIVLEPGLKNTVRTDYLKGKSMTKTDFGNLEDWPQEFNFREGWFRAFLIFECLDFSPS